MYIYIYNNYIYVCVCVFQVGWTYGTNGRGKVNECAQSGEKKEKRKTATEIGGLCEEQFQILFNLRIINMGHRAQL